VSTFLALSVIVAVLLVSTVVPAVGADTNEAQGTVDKARVTFNGFMHDKNYTWLHEHLRDAKGLLIFPQVLKAAYFIGGSGGTGVLIVRDEKTGDWSLISPAFVLFAFMPPTAATSDHQHDHD